MSIKKFDRSDDWLFSVFCSGPVANEEDGHRHANDEVEVDGMPHARLLLQEAGGVLGQRRNWSGRGSLPRRPPLHATQPVEGGRQPRLTRDAGHRGGRRVWTEGEMEVQKENQRTLSVIRCRQQRLSSTDYVKWGEQICMNHKHLELYTVVLWESALGGEKVLFIIL